MDEIKLLQQAFDGSEVLYEEAVAQSIPKPVPKSFSKKRTLKPKDYPVLFEMVAPTQRPD